MEFLVDNSMSCFVEEKKKPRKYLSIYLLANFLIL